MPRAYRGKFESNKIYDHTQKVCRAFQISLIFTLTHKKKEASIHDFSFWYHTVVSSLHEGALCRKQIPYWSYE